MGSSTNAKAGIFGKDFMNLVLSSPFISTYEVKTPERGVLLMP
jgi:hypothetical protein